MRPDAIWNEGGYYEAPPLLTNKNVKIDITKCDIIMNALGYFYLVLDGKELKSITTEEYLKYRKYVKHDYVLEGF